MYIEYSLMYEYSYFYFEYFAVALMTALRARKRQIQWSPTMG